MSKVNKVNKVTEEELERLPKNVRVDFALFCAKQCFHLIEEKHKPLCQKALDTVERYLEDKASGEECREIAYKIWEICSSNDAVYAAYGAAYAAYNVAYTYSTSRRTLKVLNNSQKAIKEQREYYQNLVDLTNIDKIFEEVVLL